MRESEGVDSVEDWVEVVLDVVRGWDRSKEERMVVFEVVVGYVVVLEKWVWGMIVDGGEVEVVERVKVDSVGE